MFRCVYIDILILKRIFLKYLSVEITLFNVFNIYV